MRRKRSARKRHLCEGRAFDCEGCHEGPARVHRGGSLQRRPSSRHRHDPLYRSQCVNLLCLSVVASSAMAFSSSRAATRFLATAVSASTTCTAFPVISFITCHVVDLPPLPSLPAPLLLQNFPSLLTARVLSPQAGSAVLDCCAAPGNKWTHLAMIMGDDGVVVSVPAGMRRSWGWTAV